MIAAAPIISLNQVSKSFGKGGAATAYVAVDRLELAEYSGSMCGP